MLNGEEESVMKASSREEGRIIAQSRFDVNEEIAPFNIPDMRVLKDMCVSRRSTSLRVSEDDGAASLPTRIQIACASLTTVADGCSLAREEIALTNVPPVVRFRLGSFRKLPQYPGRRRLDRAALRGL